MLLALSTEVRGGPRSGESDKDLLGGELGNGFKGPLIEVGQGSNFYIWKVGLSEAVALCFWKSVLTTILRYFGRSLGL